VTDINDNGFVVGTYGIINEFYQRKDAFIFSTTTGRVNIGHLSRFGSYDYFGIATAINNFNQVVGYSGDSLGSAQAFYYAPNGGMIGLDDISRANDINDAGQVVGEKFLYADIYGGLTVYTIGRLVDGGFTYDLNRITGNIGANTTILTANAINNLGQITGWYKAGNSYRAYRLDPYIDISTCLFCSGPPITGAVPEPASWAMLIAGFGLTGAMARRRRLVAPAVTA
jgi:probable HAF family extracellular repeat protein